MAQVHFRLHNKHPDGSRDIRLSYRCKNGKFFTRPTGERAKHWDGSAERLPPNAKHAGRINAHLDAMSERLKTILSEFRVAGEVPTPADIRSAWDGARIGFWMFAWGADKKSGFLANPPAGVGKSTMKKYKTMLGKLEEYQTEKKLALTFRSFNQTFADAFVEWMRKRNLNDSYIKKTLANCRALLNYAVERKQVKQVDAFDIRTVRLRAPKTYLNEEEITRFYAVRNEVSGRDQEYLDAFVLGTQIGVRVSDLVIDPGKIIMSGGEQMLDLSTRKTKTPVIIPLSTLAKEIIDRYNGRIPKIQEAHLNKLVKSVALGAGINNPIMCRRFKGGEVKEEVVEKWTMISSHTMRRSFATNMYLAGVPIAIIMRVTGHTSIADFLEYICIDEAEAAKILKGFMK